MRISCNVRRGGALVDVFVLRRRRLPYVAVLHISPYLDKLYDAISENPSITVQGLSDLFVADYGKFFDLDELREATSLV